MEKSDRDIESALYNAILYKVEQYKNIASEWANESRYCVTHMIIYFCFLYVSGEYFYNINQWRKGIQLSLLSIDALKTFNLTTVKMNKDDRILWLTCSSVVYHEAGEWKKVWQIVLFHWLYGKFHFIIVWYMAMIHNFYWWNKLFVLHVLYVTIPQIRCTDNGSLLCNQAAIHYLIESIKTTSIGKC